LGGLVAQEMLSIGICFFTGERTITVQAPKTRNSQAKGPWKGEDSLLRRPPLPLQERILPQRPEARGRSGILARFRPRAGVSWLQRLAIADAGAPNLSSFVLQQTTDSDAGGPRGGFASHNPQCRKSFSITSVWWRSMKARIFISEPHLGQHSGSAS